MAPIRLSAFYPYPEQLYGIPPRILLFAPVLVFLLILLVVFSGQYDRRIVFGSLFFGFTLAPVLRLVRIGETIVADRYTYIPSIGIFFLCGAGVAWIYERNRTRLTAVCLGLLLVLVTGMFSFLTWQRCKVWHDSVTLWTDVLKNYPRTTTAYLNRGEAFEKRGEHKQALRDYGMALKLNPWYVKARYYYNVAVVLEAQKQYEKAVEYYGRAIKENPGYASAYYNTGVIYARQKDYDKALFFYNEALKADPKHAKALYNRGVLYGLRGERKKEIADYDKVIEMDPGFAPAYNNRGVAYFQAGDYDKALADYGQALRIDPKYAEAYCNRGIIYGLKAEFDLAISEYDRALQFNPSYAEAYYQRAVAFFFQKDYSRARADIRKARQLGYQVRQDFLKQLDQATNN